MEVVTCGSFRRGRKSCGDVDILISHPDGRSHRGFLMKIIDALQQKGMIPLYTFQDASNVSLKDRYYEIPYPKWSHKSRLELVSVCRHGSKHLLTSYGLNY